MVADLALESSEQHVALVERELGDSGGATSTVDSAVRLYNVGLSRPLDDDSDVEAEEAESDDRGGSDDDEEEEDLQGEARAGPAVRPCPGPPWRTVAVLLEEKPLLLRCMLHSDSDMLFRHTPHYSAALHRWQHPKRDGCGDGERHQYAPSRRQEGPAARGGGEQQRGGWGG